jgi:uncharacterized LabA/DUF88 family protein
MAKYIYVHLTNLLVEGRRLSAFQRGPSHPLDWSNTAKSFDNTFQINIRHLYDRLATLGKAPIAKASLFGTKPPERRGIWKTAEELGFQTFIAERVRDGMREEKIDAWMVAIMLKDSCNRIDPDEDRILLVAGDSDFVPAVELLKEDGFNVDVIFWNHAAEELKLAATTFTSLDAQLKHLAYSSKPIRIGKAKKNIGSRAKD